LEADLNAQCHAAAQRPNGSAMMAVQAKENDMKLKLLHVVFAALCLATGLGVNAAHAQSCQVMLDDFINFATDPQIGGQKLIEFQMTGNRYIEDWARYATGEIYYHPGQRIGWFFIPPRLEGGGYQWFSDRTWGWDPQLSRPNPFDPNRKDGIVLSFDISPTSANYGRLTLIWGNSQVNSDPICANGAMYGFLNDQIYTITFKKVQRDAPPR